MAVEKACKADEAAGQYSQASPTSHHLTSISPRSINNMTTGDLATDRSGATAATATSDSTGGGTNTERRSLRVQIRYWGRALADFWMRRKRSSQAGVMGSASEPATSRMRESVSWPQGVNRKRLMSKGNFCLFALPSSVWE